MHTNTRHVRAAGTPRACQRDGRDTATTETPPRRRGIRGGDGQAERRGGVGGRQVAGERLIRGEATPNRAV